MTDAFPPRATFVLLLALGSCHRSPAGTAEPSLPMTASDVPDASSPAFRPVVLDAARAPETCAFGHRGVLLDFGDSSMTASLGGGSLRLGPDENVEREGANWLRVRSHVVSASFYWPVGGGTDAEDASGSAYVEARVRGLRAHAVAVAIDGKTLGTLPLAKGITRIVSLRATPPMTLAVGGHELSLHFVGGPHAGEDALAEVDWVHVGTGELAEQYPAPTHADVVTDTTVGDGSLRALSLRAPGFARCSGFIPADATLEASLATSGGGDADVEARLVLDRRAPVVLGTAHVAGRSAAWSQWSVPITGLEGRGALASLELTATRAPKGTRVLFGTPRVVAAGSVSPAAIAPARNVVVVVIGSTSAKALAPWGGGHAVPEMARVASAGVTFLANRASTSLANGVVASILTGMPPFGRDLEDAEARLASATTLPEVCRQGGVATAMFTADPTTGAAFGFERGWDAFVAHDPLDDKPGTLVFEEAADWIESHKDGRFFVLVHARGGHPPWDVTPDELKTIPPENYLGIIDPRRAAEALSKARRHPARFKEDDRIRAWALYDHAIDDHDAAFGRLMASLRTAGHEDDTVVVVTSDVAANESVPVPFGDPETLDEPLLATPLAIRWPTAPALAGRRVATSTSPVDLGRTILDALGLRPPSTFEGIDLGALAEGAAVPAERPLLAVRGGRFSLRWGSYVLVGTSERELHMCDLALDPACIADVRGTSPLALESIRRFAMSALPWKDMPPRLVAKPNMDERTAAALVRWGRAAEEAEGQKGD
ncbi:MAG TPA: sulfatase-like hydrolase/transferase [Polyangiaceae bacterium]|nr:sulfatase-like hydrolase/transferase [Polyangiaceae bacterium]